jgi:hypothetical protein
VVSRTDARQHEQFRRGKRPRRQNDLAGGRRAANFAIVEVLDPDGALAIEEDPVGTGFRHQRQTLVTDHRLQEGVRGTVATP